MRHSNAVPVPSYAQSKPFVYALQKLHFSIPRVSFLTTFSCKVAYAFWWESDDYVSSYSSLYNWRRRLATRFA